MDNTYQFLSTLEKKVWNWLMQRKILFQAQQKMFGYQEIGSATVDFIIPDRSLALRIMGGYWHSGLEAEARDELGKERLMGEGYIVVDLREADIENRLDVTMGKALQGQEML